MTELSSLDAVQALSPIFSAVGGRFMLHAETMAEAEPAGYANGFFLYAAGRGSVLGAVDADVVVAAFGFMNPDTVRSIWPSAIAVEGPTAAAERYAGLAARWGRARLAGVPGLERFAELLGRALDAASVVGLPLFAGWRAVPRPDDAAGRAYLLMHVAREWRGGAHVLATRAAGLGALEAVLTNAPGSTAGAKLFGWPEPYPDVTDLMDRRARADHLTDVLLLDGYDTLSGAERAELVALAGPIAEAIRSAT